MNDCSDWLFSRIWPARRSSTCTVISSIASVTGGGSVTMPYQRDEPASLYKPIIATVLTLYCGLFRQIYFLKVKQIVNKIVKQCSAGSFVRLVLSIKNVE